MNSHSNNIVSETVTPVSVLTDKLLIIICHIIIEYQLS